jgi:predicted metal-dependent hydrolase
MTDTPALRAVIIAAAREFNAGRYFEAHEVLEDGLETVPDELWDLFLGLIQIAVGYHKVTQRLWRGAAHMFEIGLRKVERFPAHAGGVNLEALRERVRCDLETLRAARFDAAALAQRPPRLQPLA